MCSAAKSSLAVERAVRCVLSNSCVHYLPAHTRCPTPYLSFAC